MQKWTPGALWHSHLAASLSTAFVLLLQQKAWKAPENRGNKVPASSLQWPHDARQSTRLRSHYIQVVGMGSHPPALGRDLWQGTEEWLWACTCSNCACYAVVSNSQRGQWWEWWLSFNRDRVSTWQDGKVVKLEGEDGWAVVWVPFMAWMSAPQRPMERPGCPPGHPQEVVKPLKMEPSRRKLAPWGHALEGDFAIPAPFQVSFYFPIHRKWAACAAMCSCHDALPRHMPQATTDWNLWSQA